MMIESAEEEVQGALALMERGRKTLKEARAKQHQVKMSRQFYRTDYRSTRPSGGSSTTSGGFAGKCLKCGVVGHKVAQCPQRTQDNASSAEPREEAPFVCFSEAQATGNVVREGVTSEQAMLQGKAIFRWRCNTHPRVSSGCRTFDGIESAPPRTQVSDM